MELECDPSFEVLSLCVMWAYFSGEIVLSLSVIHGNSPLWIPPFGIIPPTKNN